jgi:hypothetical protein
MFGNNLPITINKKDFKLLFMNNMIYLPICSKNNNLDINQSDFLKLINNKEIYALAYFDNFYYMSGGASTIQDWIRHSDYSSQKEVEELATLLINAGWSGNPVETAKRCLDALNGIFHECDKPEPKSDIKIDNNKFERKKSKLKLQYILQNGKNCSSCKHDCDLHYLCLIKKDVNKIGHTLNDIILICRSCMPAYKKKMKKEINT